MATNSSLHTKTYDEYTQKSRPSFTVQKQKSDISTSFRNWTIVRTRCLFLCLRSKSRGGYVQFVTVRVLGMRKAEFRAVPNFAVLTEHGVDQAYTTREMLKTEQFDAMFVSPLERSRKTGEIIWGDRNGPVVEIPHLREIDLYSFQGLLKQEGKDRFGALYKDWQKRAHQFEIDNHAPVRELWYRASIAWMATLEKYDQVMQQQNGEAGGGNLLVVAHNAVNQAMIAAAIGLPPSYFRRILQNNAATSVLDFQPSRNGTLVPRVTIDRLNQSPAPPFKTDGAGRKARGRVVLIRSAATFGSEDEILLGRLDEECSRLGLEQAFKTAELLEDVQIDVILSSPMARASQMAEQIYQLQKHYKNGRDPLPVQKRIELISMEMGDWQGRLAKEVRGQPMPNDAEPMALIMERTKAQWMEILKLAAEDEGKNVVVVSHRNVHTAFLCHVLGLKEDYFGTFRMDNGGVTVIEFPDGPLAGPGIIRCMNYTAHLGESAVPISRDDLDMVCGIDGCF
eukprot:TRINITY_DN3745_c0_g1_i12.p1 TRINITY_DN3745_c0_g1~~TRINITY_DN3745_c0_g1_i12.p1  ORF type:complete len:522 (-),score=53.33 TRINITY_DN3745_c0_g1_i12:287-1813(-)